MNIEKFCERYNFGKVINTTKITGGLMHKMFKVETDKGIYCIKVLNPEIMSREEAYNNFVVSEKVSNLAKKNNIPVSSSLDIEGNYLTKFDDMYYMVFDYVDGKTLKDDEITIEHCKKIGSVLAKIHLLDYKEIGLEPNIVKYKRLYDWESYIQNDNFNNMQYKELYLKNYKKYNSILRRANERFNESNINQTLCHRDMDAKNVMWDNDNPIIIDWECANVSNPERELLEDALCWSGFLSGNFNEEKFSIMFEEYSKYRSINNIDWYDVICGNLVGRFGWLKYNLERSLGIISDDKEEMTLAEQEVIKTIDEINRYLELIGDMEEIINKLTTKEKSSYDEVIKTIIDNNDLLKGKNYKLITAGFTNTIYQVENYIIRICTDIKNEDNFKNEIDFYKKNENNQKVPRLYHSDITKEKVPYYYEIIEKIEGKPLYEVWYKLTEEERKNIVIKLIEVLKSFHSIKTEEYDFKNFIEKEIRDILTDSNLDDELFEELLKRCDIYFEKNRFGLLHNDVHFDNVIYNKGNVSLIDFERYITGSIDYDFKRLSRYSDSPWLWASTKTDMLTVESDYENLMDMFLENYEELRTIPYIKERLEVYQIIELLYQYRNTKEIEYLDNVKIKIKKLLK